MRIEGQVDYFNEVGSYGFITSEAEDAPAKDVFFDMDDVGGPDLAEGETITFEYEMAERGPRATTVYRDDGASAGERAADDERSGDDEGDSTDTAVYTGGDDAEVRLGEDAYRELRIQMVGAFEGADYPIENPIELVPALPEGSDTTFEAGDFSMTVVELATALDTDNYPYDGVESFVDDVFRQLSATGEVRLPDAASLDDPADPGGTTSDDAAVDASDEATDADDETAGDETAGDETNVYDGRTSTANAPDGGTPAEGWDPIYRYCSSCGTDLRKYGRIASGNFCPACGSLIGE